MLDSCTIKESISVKLESNAWNVELRALTRDVMCSYSLTFEWLTWHSMFFKIDLCMENCPIIDIYYLFLYTA